MRMQFDATSPDPVHTAEPIPREPTVRFTDGTIFMYAAMVDSDSELANVQAEAQLAYQDYLIAEYRTTSRTPEMPMDEFRAGVFAVIERRRKSGGLSPKLFAIHSPLLLFLHVFHTNCGWISLWGKCGTPFERCRQAWAHAQAIDEFFYGFAQMIKGGDYGTEDEHLPD